MRANHSFTTNNAVKHSFQTLHLKEKDPIRSKIVITKRIIELITTSISLDAQFHNKMKKL